MKKIKTGPEDDYTIGCLLDYPYFENYYKMISIDLSKQQELDPDPKAIQQINFTVNLEKQILFIIEEAKETIFGFSQETMKVLWIYCKLM